MGQCTHIFQIELGLLADSSIRVERGLDTVAQAGDVHGCGQRKRARVLCAFRGWAERGTVGEILAHSAPSGLWAQGSCRQRGRYSSVAAAGSESALTESSRHYLGTGRATGGGRGLPQGHNFLVFNKALAAGRFSLEWRLLHGSEGVRGN